MTIVEMLNQSGVLTVLGVGVVFVFLLVMVNVITLVGKILGERKDSQALAAQTASGASTGVKAGGETNVIAAISAAVNEYRK
jgi:oxaloacetate decarboxylase gamma subunit